MRERASGFGRWPSVAAKGGATCWQNLDNRGVICERWDPPPSFARLPPGGGPPPPASRSHTSTDFRASRVRLFGLRVLARAAGFGLTRLWFSRIPVGRFDPVCVRLRAGRVLLSGHRAAWKRGFGARREVSAEKQGF